MVSNKLKVTYVIHNGIVNGKHCHAFQMPKFFADDVARAFLKVINNIYFGKTEIV